jgi:hypothetical protein
VFAGFDIVSDRANRASWPPHPPLLELIRPRLQKRTSLAEVVARL